jgi:glutamine synthetase
MKQFIAGQLKHAKEMCGVLCSWPNSYKRLVPGYEAPIYIAWDYKNRSTLIRVPNFFGSEKAARFEIRCPDGAGNIYLQLACLIQAGLDGIENLKAEDLPKPALMNVFKLSEEEKKAKGIENLPGYLSESLEHFKESEFMKKVLGEAAFDAYYDVKKKESNLYRQQVSNWELDRYIGRL